MEGLEKVESSWQHSALCFLITVPIMQSWGPWVFAPEFSPYSPEVVKEALLQLRQQQGDGCLGVHGDDPLARA